MVTELFAVVGKPVLHSMSPQMHNAAFHALGMDAVYVRLAAESAEDALESAGVIGISGMNVTAPFKEEMAALVQAGDEAVRKLAAVNTVLMRDGNTIGYNTDPDGVAGALQESKVPVKGKQAVVLGAGGAAKAASFALVEGGADVIVANRTAEKAKAIAKMLGCGHCALDDMDALRGADILVSALNTGERVIEPVLLKKNIAVLDANYSTETALVRDAKKKGCRTIDGREWLLYQGVRAFELFSKRKAPVAVMRKALYARNSKPKTKSPKHTTGNLALIGMMGSGKDATAKALGRSSGMGIMDVDAEIERKAGKKIKDIFANKGEEAFRRMESREIREVANARNKIVNCGGGAVLKTQNRKTLNRNSLVVWLWAKPSVMVKRVAGDDSRPLLHAPEHEKEVILTRLLGNRRRFYAETADLMIDTGGRSAGQVAERILYEVHKARGD
ncbi:shikimate dehydrogenase [Candidatus Micrarchaeota archaeon]|nr:shikimate dehydrogenase [Candidatus Micrarchaeota archaeon]